MSTSKKKQKSNTFQIIKESVFIKRSMGIIGIFVSIMGIVVQLIAISKGKQIYLMQRYHALSNYSDIIVDKNPDPSSYYSVILVNFIFMGFFLFYSLNAFKSPKEVNLK